MFQSKLPSNLVESIKGFDFTSPVTKINGKIYQKNAYNLIYICNNEMIEYRDYTHIYVHVFQHTCIYWHLLENMYGLKGYFSISKKGRNLNWRSNCNEVVSNFNQIKLSFRL